MGEGRRWWKLCQELQLGELKKRAGVQAFSPAARGAAGTRGDLSGAGDWLSELLPLPPPLPLQLLQAPQLRWSYLQKASCQRQPSLWRRKPRFLLAGTLLHNLL